jgi:hypothetical protein
VRATEEERQTRRKGHGGGATFKRDDDKDGKEGVRDVVEVDVFIIILIGTVCSCGDRSCCVKVSDEPDLDSAVSTSPPWGIVDHPQREDNRAEGSGHRSSHTPLGHLLENNDSSSVPCTAVCQGYQREGR